MLPNLSELGIHDADDTGTKPKPKGSLGLAGRALHKLKGPDLPMGPFEHPLRDMPTPSEYDAPNAWLRSAPPDRQSKITSLFANVNPDALSGKDTRESGDYNQLSPVGIFDIVYRSDMGWSPLQRYMTKRTTMSIAPRACLTWASREECVRTDAVLANLYTDRKVNGLGALNDKINEKYLLHGTGINGIKGIVYSGFDTNRTSGGRAFGDAIYHAEDPEKANHYATSEGWEEFNEELQITGQNADNTYYMLVSRVLLGCANHVYKDQMNKGGEIKDPLSNKVYAGQSNWMLAGGYDSVIKEHGMTVRGTPSTGDKFREFLVVDPEQILPVMLIAYKRQTVDAKVLAYHPNRFNCDSVGPLVDLLSRGTDAEKESATRLLAMQASNSNRSDVPNGSDTNERIMRSGAVAALVALLGNGNFSTKRWCTITLNKLLLWERNRTTAGFVTDVRAQVLRANAIPPLVSFLSATLEATENRADVEPSLFGTMDPRYRTNEALRFSGREAATNLLWGLLQGPPGRDGGVREALVEQGAVPVLVQLLHIPHRDTHIVVSALRELSSVPKGAKDIYTSGGIPYLLGLLRVPLSGPEASERALYTLANMVGALRDSPHERQALEQIADADWAVEPQTTIQKRVAIGENGIRLLTRRLYFLKTTDLEGSQKAAALLDAIAGLGPTYESRVAYWLRVDAPVDAVVA